MDTKSKLVGIIATAAAVAFVTAPVTSMTAQAAKKVPCYGVNSCKGHSKCKTANNACKGQNSCKGQGMVMKSEKKCAKMGGSTTEPAAASQQPST